MKFDELDSSLGYRLLLIGFSLIIIVICIRNAVNYSKILTPKKVVLEENIPPLLKGGEYGLGVGVTWWLYYLNILIAILSIIACAYLVFRLLTKKSIFGLIPDRFFKGKAKPILYNVNLERQIAEEKAEDEATEMVDRFLEVARTPVDFSRNTESIMTLPAPTTSGLTTPVISPARTPISSTNSLPPMLIFTQQKKEYEDDHINIIFQKFKEKLNIGYYIQNDNNKIGNDRLKILKIINDDNGIISSENDTELKDFIKKKANASLSIGTNGYCQGVVKGSSEPEVPLYDCADSIFNELVNNNKLIVVDKNKDDNLDKLEKIVNPVQDDNKPKFPKQEEIIKSFIKGNCDRKTYRQIYECIMKYNNKGYTQEDINKVINELKKLNLSDNIELKGEITGNKKGDIEGEIIKSCVSGNTTENKIETDECKNTVKENVKDIINVSDNVENKEAIREAIKKRLEIGDEDTSNDQGIGEHIESGNCKGKTFGNIVDDCINKYNKPEPVQPKYDIQEVIKELGKKRENIKIKLRGKEYNFSFKLPDDILNRVNINEKCANSQNNDDCINNFEITVKEGVLDLDDVENFNLYKDYLNNDGYFDVDDNNKFREYIINSCKNIKGFDDGGEINQCVDRKNTEMYNIREAIIDKINNTQGKKYYSKIYDTSNQMLLTQFDGKEKIEEYIIANCKDKGKDDCVNSFTFNDEEFNEYWTDDKIDEFVNIYKQKYTDWKSNDKTNTDQKIKDLVKSVCNQFGGESKIIIVGNKCLSTIHSKVNSS